MEMVEEKIEKVLMNIPTDMVEEILLKLPVKSLLRFSSVSKAWKSMISEYRFVKRYSRRADRELKHFVASSSHKVCNVSSILSLSSSTETKFESAVVCPFSKNPRLLASCEELWLACDEKFKSLFLWNPSMRTYKRLSNPTIQHSHRIYNYAYGLVYDSAAADDYKILKIQSGARAELYSLRSDSWREISDFPTDRNWYMQPYGVFVGGNLHWWSHDQVVDIISFNLSTEKFGLVAKPNYSMSHERQICVLKGMLCVHYDYFSNEKSDIWVMHEYGVATSWTKIFTIKHFFLPSRLQFGRVVPLYIYENGELLIRTSNYTYSIQYGIFVYKDDKTTPRKVFEYGLGEFNGGMTVHNFLYVDSLVAPAMWSTTPSDSVRELTR